MNIEPTRSTKSKTTRKPAATRAKGSDATMAPTTPTAPASKRRQAMSATEDLQGLIQRRAYELHCERGYRHGCAMDDWLEAEREILTQRRLE